MTDRTLNGTVSMSVKPPFKERACVLSEASEKSLAPVMGKVGLSMSCRARTANVG